MDYHINTPYEHTFDKTFVKRDLSDKTILIFKINVYAKLFKWTKK